MTWIYNLPVWLFSLGVIFGMCAIACFGHWLILRYTPSSDFIRHNGVASPLLGIIGTAYAVLLSFIVVVVWQQYNDSDNVVATEANAVSDMHRLGDALPQPTGERVKEELDRYIRLMISDEWPAMKRGTWSPEAQALAHTITDQLDTAAPRNAAQQNTQALALAIDRAMLDARRQRLHDNETGIPWILWSALWFVAVVTIGFSYLFGMESLRVQLTMTAALTATIAVMFVLIAELDYPFRGDVAVSPHSWYQVERQLHSFR